MKYIILTFFIFSLLLSPVTVSAQGSGTFKPVDINNAGNSNGDIGATLKTLGPAVLSCVLASEVGSKIIGAIGRDISSTINDLAGSLGPIGAPLKFLTNKATGGPPVVDQVARDRLKAINQKEQCWDQVAKGLANKAMITMTNKTIGWVNTGFDGNPLYVRDIDNYLKTIRNQQIAKFLPDTQNSDPIFGNALRSIITKQVTGKTDGLLNKTKKTPEAVAYTKFTNDFTQGGWGALLNTSNNPLSAIFRESNNLNNKLQNQVTNTRGELNRNSGFLDVRKCIETDKEDSTKCARYSTITPGSVIADQLGTTLGSTFRQLEAVDEINEVVSGFFNKLVDGLFKKNTGLFGLGSLAGGYGGTGFGSNQLLDEFKNPIASENFLNTIQPQPGISDTDVSRPQVLRRLIVIQKDLLTTTNDVTIVARNILPELAQLDYCMPGPNPTWQSGFSDNLQSLVGNSVYDVANKVEAVVKTFPVTDKITGIERTVNGPGIFTKKDYSKNITFSNGSGNTIVGIGFNISGGSNNQAVWSDYFSRVGLALAEEINTTYNSTTVPAAFGAASNGNSVAVGLATTAYRATAALVPFAQSVAELETNNGGLQNQITANLAELEGIHAEALAIVKVAKARYIAQRAAAGKPVDMTCINTAYEINDVMPINGTEQPQESSAINPKVRAVQEAYNYFNSTL